MYKPSYGYCIIMLIMIFGVTACGSTSINNYKSEKTVSVKDESTWNYRSEKVEKAQNIASADPESLQDDDFEVSYRSHKIDKNTDIKELIHKWGYSEGFEANNRGYNSGNGTYRRWSLSYPNYEEPEIRFVVLSKIELEGEELVDGESYLVAVSLENPKFNTKRGLKIGDTLGKVLQLYGKPSIVTNGSLLYSKNGLHLRIQWDTETEKVNNIFIEYNMEKSIEQQRSADYVEEDAQPDPDLEPYTIQREQSFTTTLNGWGEVKFISTLKDEDTNDLIQAKFFLEVNSDKNVENKILYEFPEFYGNKGRMIDRIKAVSFKDLNQDGRTDIVIIADYITGVNAHGIETLPVAGIYFQKKDKTYTTLPELDKSINQTGHNRTLQNVIQYVSKQRINVQ
ncbi:MULTISPECIES: hypothetical protein [Paenibacillus]|uniref:Lipoprotein n=2 Tax=Paenibacillus TaxID=44249 RepID=A0A8I1IPL6_PAEPO|nr:MULTISPECIES: hypothetical protein [Paenibacillus]KAF6575836.1 hypothetical protein G9G53_05405 [Paenibacillus sp. EKM206P]KAF6589469.1 hypothetical protein G9G52_09290 [Paenibacillus sp. EKM205P]MBM0633512.1 hypothetical protein [Paenibacillus polymyxa]UMY54583.1 hypothetical protein MLD56_24155 [Paenibacillus peoriae]